MLTSLFSAFPEGQGEQEMEDFMDRYSLEVIQADDLTTKVEAWRTCTILRKTSALWIKLKPHFQVSVASLKFAESYASSSAVIEKEEGVSWWQEMMENYLQGACSSEVPAVRAAACDCFASMAKEIFEKFHVSFSWSVTTVFLFLLIAKK